MTEKPASRHDVTRLFGTLSDHTLLRVLDTGAPLDQLEEVAMWIAQEDDVMGEARRPLTGVPAQVLDWIEQDDILPDEDLR